MAQSRCHRLSAEPGQAGDFRRPKQNRPLAGVDETVDHAQQRGFAGARAADDADHLAFGDDDVDAVDGGVLAKTTRDGADLERR